MVHPVTIKQRRFWNEQFGTDLQTQRRVEYFLELWYIVACLLFVVGSIYFAIDTEEAERPGCLCFDIGSIMFAAGSFLYLMEGIYFEQPAETHRKKRRNQGRSCVWRVVHSEHLDQALYCIGSLVFLAGTLIWDPSLAPYFLQLGGDQMTRTDWLRIADSLFMIGSFGFSFASFLSALSVHREHELFKEHAVIITSCYQFGGFFFIAGGMAYVPGYGCMRSFQVMGAYLFLVGSLLYLVGCTLSLLKRIATYQAAKEHLSAAGTIQGFVRRWRNAAALRKQIDQLKQSPRNGNGADMDSVASLGSSPRSPDIGDVDPARLQRLLEVVSRFQEVGWQRQQQRRRQGDHSPSPECSPRASEDEGEGPEFRRLLSTALWPSGGVALRRSTVSPRQRLEGRGGDLRSNRSRFHVGGGDGGGPPAWGTGGGFATLPCGSRSSSDEEGTGSDEDDDDDDASSTEDRSAGGGDGVAPHRSARHVRVAPALPA